ncbi:MULTISPECIES: hypothetical protein [Nocardioides]|uniref:Uncharacterized protein n=1 Tax=Nocardioides vastitatis TaxID=2568655 RepID=A0ABW0ZSD5_9ACTN|nr:hypothetical protein [Nocardioides sp.]
MSQQPPSGSQSGSPTTTRRHLMDPTAPRRPPAPEDHARLQRVQRRVVSVLVITTVLHLVAGLVIAAEHVPEDRIDAKVALNLIAAAFMVGGIAGTLAINGRTLRSPWLLLGLVPGVVGIWWTCL